MGEIGTTAQHKLVLQHNINWYYSTT